MTNTETPAAPEAAPVSPERLTYTKKELGRALGLGPTSIWRLEKRGLLRSLPGIRHKLFSVGEVRRYLGDAA